MQVIYNTNAAYLIIICYRMQTTISKCITISYTKLRRNKIIDTKSMNIKNLHSFSFFCRQSNRVELCCVVSVFVFSRRHLLLSTFVYTQPLSVFCVTRFCVLSCGCLILTSATIVSVLCFCWSTIPFIVFFLSGSSLSYVLNPGKKEWSAFNVCRSYCQHDTCETNEESHMNLKIQTKMIRSVTEEYYCSRIRINFFCAAFVMHENKNYFHQVK